MFARQHQLQLDARQLDEGAFGLGWRDGEAAIEVADEVLGEIAVSGGVIGNAVMPEFLRQAPLEGAEGALAAPLPKPADAATWSPMARLSRSSRENRTSRTPRWTGEDSNSRYRL